MLQQWASLSESTFSTVTTSQHPHPLDWHQLSLTPCLQPDLPSGPHLSARGGVERSRWHILGPQTRWHSVAGECWPAQSSQPEGSAQPSALLSEVSGLARIGSWAQPSSSTKAICRNHFCHGVGESRFVSRLSPVSLNPTAQTGDEVTSVAPGRGNEQITKVSTPLFQDPSLSFK